MKLQQAELQKERMTEKLNRMNLQGRMATLGTTQTGRALSLRTRSILTLILVATAGAGQHANAQAKQPGYQMPAGGFGATPQLVLPKLPTPTAITPNGSVVEDVIARVNDQIVTRSEYERSQQKLLQDAQQRNYSPTDLEDAQQTLLRDMIDQQLLLSKGKELGITGDSEVIRELDDIRKQNHLDSMEALEKAAAQQGVSFEDFKQGLRTQIVTQQVVRDEVGRRLQLTHAQEAAYYAAHAKEFQVPEQVHLSEILIPTAESASEADISAAQAKADALAAKLKAGESFAAVAKASSGGPTASAGGDLGDFPRGKLGDVLENATFPLPVGGNTAPIRTRQGFVILHVDAHQAGGIAPISDVGPQIEQAIYMDQLQPALRAYLTKAREQAYIEIAPGFVDAGSSRKQTKPVYTAYAAPAVKKKVQVKQRVEQERADKAQAELAAAREKVAQKQAQKAAQGSQKAGVKNVSMPVKPKRIPREKIHFGQAPRNSLPAGTATTPTVVQAGAPLTGQAPGVAMAPTESITSITTGTGVDGDADPFAPKTTAGKKTRFAAHESEAEEAHAKGQLVKAQAKATTRPVAATQTESATEKQQAAPLGLSGDTKKKVKIKRQKGDPKERLQEKAKPVEGPTPVAPTVNPALAAPVPGAAPAATPPAAPTTAPTPQ